MKKLTNLKGVKTLNKNEQKDIYGGGFSFVIGGGGGISACQIGCAGLSHGDACFASGTTGNCYCPGGCTTNGGGALFCMPK